MRSGPPPIYTHRRRPFGSFVDCKKTNTKCKITKSIFCTNGRGRRASPTTKIMKIIGGVQENHRRLRRGSRPAECEMCIRFVHIYIKAHKYAQKAQNTPNQDFSDFAPLVATLFWSYPGPRSGENFFVFGMAHSEKFSPLRGAKFLPGGCAPRTPALLLSCSGTRIRLFRTQTMRLGPFSPGAHAPRQNRFCPRRPPGAM